MINLEKLKEVLLDLLRSDREFRRAVAAELGLLEILERMDRLEERMARIEERMLRVEERLEEHARAIRALQEQVARLQEQVVEHTKAIRALQEQMVRLEERVVKVEEQLVEVTKAVKGLYERIAEMQRLVNVIAHRFGLLSEAGLRETLKAVIEDILGAGEVAKLTIRDEEGIVYGYPSLIDFDVVMRDKEHVIIEIKSRVDPGDVRIAALKAKLYEKIYGVKPRVVIVGGFVHPKAYEAAGKLGVEIRPAFSEESYLA